MTAELTIEYYLRVSVKETKFILNQYNFFEAHTAEKTSREILQLMLANVIRIYKLDATTVVVEQFSKM